MDLSKLLARLNPSPEIGQTARARLASLRDPSGLARPAGEMVPAALSPVNPARRMAVLAVAAIVLVAALAGFGWWRAGRQPVSTVVAEGGSGRSEGAQAELVIAVSGRVAKPGLVRVPTGSRVADAITAAGGLLPDANTASLNLARKVRDGELITVGVAGAPASGPGGAETGDGLVSLNSATVAQLDALDGVGPVLAQRIVDYRDSHGGFGSVEELQQVDGIGPARFAQLRDLVTT